MTLPDTNSTERRMRQVLAEMSVLSEVPAARAPDARASEKFKEGGTRLLAKRKVAHEAVAPRGPNRSLADEFAARFERASGPIARGRVLEQAEQALREARLSPRTDLLANTLEWRMAIVADPRRAPEVARVFGCSVRHVYRLRAMSKETG